MENHENASLAKTSSSTVGTFWSWKNFAPFALFQILSYFTVSSTTNLSISDVILPTGQTTNHIRRIKTAVEEFSLDDLNNRINSPG